MKKYELGQKVLFIKRGTDEWFLYRGETGVTRFEGEIAKIDFTGTFTATVHYWQETTKGRRRYQMTVPFSRLATLEEIEATLAKLEVMRKEADAQEVFNAQERILKNARRKERQAREAVEHAKKELARLEQQLVMATAELLVVEG